MGDRVFALLAGGGTGGHVYPAVALAQELVARGHSRESIRFVGARRGVEGRVVPEAGFEIDLLPGRGWQRRVTVKNILANVGVAWETVVAIVRANAARRAVPAACRRGLRRVRVASVRARRAGATGADRRA